MKLIVANLKLYLDVQNLKTYLDKAKHFDKNIVICPSSIHIPYFLKNNYKVGIQNIAPKSIPSQTGEVSATQAKNLGVSYVIIGHSERRKDFNETNELINSKILEALNNDLKVILCVGETLEEYQTNKTKEVIKNQLEKTLKNVSKDIIIAYEPIYAIGTGNTPTNKIIDENALYIKETVQKLINKVPKVLYGGSVSNTNILTLETLNNVDGYLIGSSSSKIDVLTEIIEKVSRQNMTK